MSRWAIPWLAAGIVLCAQPALGQKRYEARTAYFGPRAVVRIQKPQLRWEVWCDDSKVTSAEMTVDDKVVPARYDPTTRCLSYAPSTPLSVGPHHVECHIIVDDAVTFSRDWTTTIAPDAIETLPAAGADQVRALEIANALRRAGGLPEMVLDPRLCAAALGHVEYLTANNLIGHGERPGTPKFLGASPGDRLEAFGFGSSSWEGVTYGPTTVDEAMRALFDAPYHRIPLLQPGALMFGSGFGSQRLDVEIEETGAAAIVCSPADGQKGVPTQWLSREDPDPFRLYPGAGPLGGYPIVCAVFGPGEQSIKISSAVLTDDQGAAVEAYVNSPANDGQLTNAVVIIARRPLKAKSWYRVHIEASDASGSPIAANWRFETGA